MSDRGRSLERVKKDMLALADSACEEWEREIAKDPNQTLKLYYRKPNSKQQIGRLKVTAHQPRKGWMLVSGFVMSQRWSRDDVLYYIKSMMVKLPILRGPINTMPP